MALFVRIVYIYIYDIYIYLYCPYIYIFISYIYIHIFLIYIYMLCEVALVAGENRDLIIGDGHQPNSRGLYTHYKDSLLKVG